jgi:hypothetical protein
MDNGATALLSDRKTNAASSKSAVMSSNTWTRRLAPDAMNNRDEVVRTYVGSSGNGHGFIYDNGTLTTLNVPGSSSADALAINNRGEVAPSDASPGAPSPPVGGIHRDGCRRGDRLSGIAAQPGTRLAGARGTIVSRRSTSRPPRR